MLQYNADNKIISLYRKYDSITYGYMPDFSMKYFHNNFSSEIKNTVTNASGNIIKAEKWNNGSFTATFEYSYDGQGYLESMKEVKQAATYVTNYEYQQGNCTGFKNFKSGVLSYTHELTYYTDKPNAFKLDLQEVRELGFVVDDRFGKLNKNLLKRWKSYNNSQNQVAYDEQYSYTTDAEGYVAQMESMAKNGFVTTYSYQYQ